LYYGRICAVIIDDQLFSSNSRKLNMDMDIFKKRFRLQTRSTWIAFIKNTPDITINEWQETFGSIPDKEIETIFKSYGFNK
jgi:hypothetical protein